MLRPSAGQRVQPAQATIGGRSRNNCAKRRPALATDRPAIGQWLRILARSHSNHWRNGARTSGQFTSAMRGERACIERDLAHGGAPPCAAAPWPAAVDSSIRSTTGRETPSSAYTRRPDEISADGNSSKSWPEQIPAREAAAASWWPTAAAASEEREAKSHSLKSSSYAQHIELSIRVGSRIQYLCDPQWFRDTASRGPTTIVAPESQFGLAHRIMYGPFNPYIPIRSTTIGKSRVAKDPIAMHTSWRSNSDIASVTRVSMTLRVVRTNQYNQDIGLIHSTNGNHLESPNEASLKLGRPYPHFDGPID
ncbi:hypothetical protein F511_29706 [Dorcoceras hygrometricum]|uniref:Uncharacterized protein n=1 Tax=Dorcoceras hygrometricum TaxID=472368 RepID=A0A2Z7BKD7_9LAMI|nr:hypothetical protein F511_29706 [Dorcoceras hygrometricum]